MGSKSILVTAKIVLLLVTLCNSVSAYGNKLYWITDHMIHSIDLIDGQTHDLLEVKGNLTDLAIDKVSDYVYWSIASGGGKIEKAHLDGTGLETLITPSTFLFLNDIELDVVNKKMYFCDRRNNVIYRANLDGSEIEIIIPTSGSPNNSIGISKIELDKFNRKIYWVDNSYYQTRIKRSDLEGSNVEDLVFGWKCVTDIALDVKNGKMYWTDSGRSRNSGRILRASLDGSNLEVLIDSGLYWPCGITIDLTGSNLFWIDTWYSGPTDYDSTIQYSDLDGNNVQTLINFGPSVLNMPNSLFFVPEPALIIAVDIKPQSCPNPLNVKSSGVLPVAILGTADVNVIDIDPTSIRLTGVEPLRSSFEDVAGPVSDSNDCNCITEGPDGFLDLTLKFKTQRIVEAIGEVNHGDEVMLTLTGVLFGERPIEGADCILIRGRHKPFNKADINKDGVVNTADFAIVAENWLQSSISED